MRTDFFVETRDGQGEWRVIGTVSLVGAERSLTLGTDCPVRVRSRETRRAIEGACRFLADEPAASRVALECGLRVGPL
jgi:hypothetical protein